MDGAEPQERTTVRCIVPGVIKSEFSGNSALNGQSERIRHSCNSTPMELSRYNKSRGNDSGDRTNDRLAATSDGINNPSNCIENKQTNNLSFSLDKLNTNGLDNKTSKIEQIVEDAISPDSKQAVMKILDQVNELSTAEKLLLYLKLPTGKSGNVDPLRQPLNPLGCRFEIHQTITWIKTHLEEDPDVSLPKQNVYEEYIVYCNSNGMKPLSTADFGKVMKQVFPCVRPRRLGTRGNSRYCYAGMRKRIKLEVPLLPDIGEETKLSSSSSSEDELLSAASCLICEWAQKLLGVTFKSLRDLACHLVENLCVDSRSVAAFTILSSSSGSKAVPSLSSSKLCRGKVGLQVVSPGGSVSKHRETQLQLQRKLQEREVIREQKRKLQEQTAALTKRNPVSSVSEKQKVKRPKLSIKATTYGSTNIATQGNCSEDGPICDKDYSRAKQGRRRRSCRLQQVEGERTPGMVNGNPVQENSRDSAACNKTASRYLSAIGDILEVEKQPIISSQRTEAASLKRSHSANCADEVVKSTASHQDTTSTNKSPTTFSPVQELNHNVVKRSSTQPVCEEVLANPVANVGSSPVNKLPIPRLSNPNKPTKQLANVIIFPPVLQQKLPKFKYKPIQPKPDNEGDRERFGGDGDEGCAKQTDTTGTGDVVLADGMNKEPSSVSIGCLEKDALDDYLHGGNNSQEQEEELMRYFQHQNSSSSNEEPEDGTHREASETYPATAESSKSDKLSQLRLLLEKNLNQAPCVSRGGPFKTTGGRSVPPSSTETPSSSLSFEDLTDASPGNGDVFLPNSAAVNTTATAGPASTSLSLLSQRSQNCARGKPAVLLPSLLSNGTHMNFGSRRRVSFETSVMEHYHDGVHHTTASVPPSPNTRRRIFSFTPISPGPHSPLGPQRASSKPSSANASPFVSPRNTPVPRSRHNSGQTALNHNISFLATHQMQNGGNILTLGRTRHSTMAARVVRSNSVNSHSSGLPQYQVPRPRAMSITTPVLQAVRDSILPGQTNGHFDTEARNMFAVPGELHLPTLQAGSRQTALNTSAAPMSPLSVSAPQSPMIPFQQSVSSASSPLSVPSTNPDHFSSPAPQSLLQEVLQTTNIPDFTKKTFVSAKCKMDTQDTLLPGTVDVANRPAGLSINVDPLAKEVSQFFPDDHNFTSVLTTAIGLQPSSHRSQSVPLHRMTSASQQQQQESPLYVNHSTTAFNFNHFTSSATSSVAATPVPSEFTDFVSVGDSSTAPSTDLLLVNGDAETTELNSENLNRIFNLLDDVQQEEHQKEQQQMLTLDIDVAQQHNQKFLFQPSRSYPNTPLPYQSISNTRDPVVGSSATCLPSENIAALTSRSYPSTPLLGHPMFGGCEDDGPFQQELGNVSSVKSVSQLTLNALNIRTMGPSFAARRNINPLLEQLSFSVDDELALDTLDSLHECDTLTQLVQEVSNPASDACT
ncbi:uncharacterized protein LOC110840398 isoform X2 [Zootermopsis nevadensis]|uniref:uncharacterized protein LOC110840398 isoform X2 n=1 Tax=Zootermopsis nevadensis TaxID=136037 RepID=UPI000B8EC776|nr:uncharacterized protein LOC110840398 isoform X2 [Zootermopsis nevadensis]